MDGAMLLLVLMLACALLLGVCLARVRSLSRDVDQIKQRLDGTSSGLSSEDFKKLLDGLNG